METEKEFLPNGWPVDIDRPSRKATGSGLARVSIAHYQSTPESTSPPVDTEPTPEPQE